MLRRYLLLKPRVCNMQLMPCAEVHHILSILVPTSQSKRTYNIFFPVFANFSIKIAHHYQTFSSFPVVCYYLVQHLIELILFVIFLILTWCIHHYTCMTNIFTGVACNRNSIILSD